MIKNEILTVECAGLGADFEGICRHEGQVLFAHGALPGETVRVRVTKITKRYAFGRLEAVLSPSPERATPPCPAVPRCGGCTAQHLSYEATLRQKRQQVVDCLTRIGGFEAPDVRETLGMENPWRYRNKGAFPVGGTAGVPVLGCFAARSHSIVDVPGGCLLQSEQSDALMAVARQWMTHYRIQPYREDAHLGLVRHIMTRQAKDGGAMLVLVINGRDIPHADALIQAARGAVPDLRSVILSENTERTNVILGNRFATLWGEDALEDEIAGMRMRISPRTFFQVNRAQAERLYAEALAFAEFTGKEKAWDLYCGCGSITLLLAKQAAWVTGVEIVPEAIADARENARRSGVQNADFIAGAAEIVLPALAKEGRPDVVVLDPPRKGCEEPALLAVAEAKPERIVYVSCNPATLARDAAILREKGYRLGTAQPVDMFGWTGHVETIVLMSIK